MTASKPNPTVPAVQEINDITPMSSFFSSPAAKTTNPNTATTTQDKEKTLENQAYQCLR